MGNFQHLITNGLDFSAFLSHDEDKQVEEEEEIIEGKLPEIRDIELLRTCPSGQRYVRSSTPPPTRS